jgi:putative N6-adenine-specific DNA methylase
MKPYKISAVFQPGLENFAEQELTRLGVSNFKKNESGFEFAGHQNLIFKLNCESKIFSRFRIRLVEGKVRFEKDLKELIRKIQWSDFLSNQKLKLKVYSFRSKLYHEGKITEIAQKTLLELHPNLNNGESEQEILIHIVENRATISIDTTGNHLHKRGYAVLKEKAPLRETIAAAMIAYVSINTTFDTIIDPMCGSGTILSEALLNSSNFNTGKLRKFSFQYWPSYQSDRFDKYLDSIPKSSTNLTIQAYDINEKAIQSTQENLSIFSDFEQEITQQDLFELKNIPKNSVLITNPPYGKRILKTGEAIKIYNQLITLANHGFKVCFLIPDSLQKRLKLNKKPIFTFFNGTIKTNFLCFNLS